MLTQHICHHQGLGDDCECWCEIGEDHTHAEYYKWLMRKDYDA